MDKSAFLVGRAVYIRPPDIEKDVLTGDWFSWFNDKATTKYLGQGVWPNTVAKQRDFVETIEKDKSKLLLCIINRKDNAHIGVISLSEIDLLNRKATISLVFGPERHPKEAPIEAMALMTEYGFDRLNLLKINAGQSQGLWTWVNTLELVGYRIEGYVHSIMVRDGIIHDGVQIGITAERFYRMKKERGGSLLPGDIDGLLRSRRKENMVEKTKLVLQTLYND